MYLRREFRFDRVVMALLIKRESGESPELFPQL